MPAQDDQALTLSGSDLILEDGGTVNMTSFLDNTDDQALTLSGTDFNFRRWWNGLIYLPSWMMPAQMIKH